MNETLTLPFGADSGLSSPREKDEASGTFIDNMRLPVHRWFRFSAGFSARWAESVIAAHGGGAARVLDPFAGSGTTLLAAEEQGAASMGVEAHPFIERVARAKLCRATLSPADFLALTREVEEAARVVSPSLEGFPALIHKCFTREALMDLARLRAALESLEDDSDAWRLAWLALVSILRPCSHVGTAQWQYVLPNKRKRKAQEPFEAFRLVAEQMANDLRLSQTKSLSRKPVLVASDARTCDGVPDGFASLVVTSPPYANNFDYADATRLEMSFLGEIQSWGDLQQSVRRHLVRACSQHVPQSALSLDELLARPEVAPILEELEPVCRKLEQLRLTRAGKKTYHLMVAAYFLDLALVWRSLRRVCAEGATVCFVIGDSAPYGVHAPAEKWLGELAVAAGFESHRFEKVRDRNVKWKNRKHRVPLQEGRLWVR